MLWKNQLKKSISLRQKLKNNLVFIFIYAWCISSISCIAQNTINLNPCAKNFTISLAGNPTTGYSWTLDTYDKTLVTLEKSTYKPNKTELIGSGGSNIFCFSINKVQQGFTTKLSFSYKRPWEKNIIAKTQSFTVISSACTANSKAAKTKTQ